MSARRGSTGPAAGAGETDALRLRPRHRAPAHREQQVAQVRTGRAAPVGRRHGLRLAGAGGAGTARARRARDLRLPPRAAGVLRDRHRSPLEALRLARGAGGGAAPARGDPVLQHGGAGADRAWRRHADADPGLPTNPEMPRQHGAHAGRGPAREHGRRSVRSGLGCLRARHPAAHPPVPAVQPAQPGGARLPAGGARAHGRGVRAARPRDLRRRDPRRPALRGPPARARRHPGPRGGGADDHA